MVGLRVQLLTMVHAHYSYRYDNHMHVEWCSTIPRSSVSASAVVQLLKLEGSIIRLTLNALLAALFMVSSTALRDMIPLKLKRSTRSSRTRWSGGHSLYPGPSVDLMLVLSSAIERF